jgi:hypothetical protein
MDLVDLVVQASLVAEQMLAGSWEKLTVIYNRYVNMVTYLQAQSTVYSPKVFNGALKIGLESSYELEGPRPPPPPPPPSCCRWHATSARRRELSTCGRTCCSRSRLS